MHFAIYSRKSKFTGTGDSVENQVQMCRDYLSLNYRDQDYTVSVYEDEGFSGKSTNRPMFQRLLGDLKKGGLDAVICYRLDRLSRSVSDFSQLLDMLQEHHIEFISIRENFDTSTPMGRAMINIASVFAQLERETIAERVRDNKILIAREGRWQGGNAPLGMKITASAYLDADGRKRTVYYAAEDAESPFHAIVRLIYSRMLRERSTIKVERYLLQNHVKTPQGKDFTVTQITSVLRNPVYARNDACVYDYLQSEGCAMANPREDFDGGRGVTGYGKTRGDRRQRTGHGDWIISVGRHRGMVPGEDWVAVQKMLDRNRKSPRRLQTSGVALLSGILRCSCGAPMLVKGNRPDKNGNALFYYKCTRKDRSRGELCQVGNIQGPELDREVCRQIRAMLDASGPLEDDIRLNRPRLAQAKARLEKQIFTLKDQIAQREADAENVVLRLGDARLPDSALPIIESTLAKISRELEDMRKELDDLQSQSAARSDRESLAFIGDAAKRFLSLDESAGVKETRDLLKWVIHSIEWDGSAFDAHIFRDGVDIQPSKNV